MVKSTEDGLSRGTPAASSNKGTILKLPPRPTATASLRSGVKRTICPAANLCAGIVRSSGLNRRRTAIRRALLGEFEKGAGSFDARPCAEDRRELGAAVARTHPYRELSSTSDSS